MLSYMTCRHGVCLIPYPLPTLPSAHFIHSPLSCFHLSTSVFSFLCLLISYSYFPYYSHPVSHSQSAQLLLLLCISDSLSVFLLIVPFNLSGTVVSMPVH